MVDTHSDKFLAEEEWAVPVVDTNWVLGTNYSKNTVPGHQAPDTGARTNNNEYY